MQEFEGTETENAEDDCTLPASSIPAEWVRHQLKSVGKTLRGEVTALKQLEEHIKALRTATQEYADACDKQGSGAIAPAIDKVRRAREAKIRQVQLVHNARVALTQTEAKTANELSRLTQILPSWQHVAKAEAVIASEERPTLRLRAVRR